MINQKVDNVEAKAIAAEICNRLCNYDDFIDYVIWADSKGWDLLYFETPRAVEAYFLYQGHWNDITEE